MNKQTYIVVWSMFFLPSAHMVYGKLTNILSLILVSDKKKKEKKVIEKNEALTILQE